MKSGDHMLKFLTPQLYDTFVWGLIVFGSALALWRLYKDLTGPPRWPPDDDDLEGDDSPASGPSGPKQH
jgi:hypothetical protein